MRFRRRLTLQALIVFVICVFLILVFNAYFLHLHSKSQQREENDSKGSKTRSSSIVIATTRPSWKLNSLAERIQWRWRSIDEYGLAAVPPQGSPAKILAPRSTALSNLPNTSYAIWKLAKRWVGSRQVYPSLQTNQKLIKEVLQAMATFPITKAKVGSGGTQLKLTLTLQGAQKAVFKPMRYPRDTIFTNEPYAGADRHNGEIVAFHLSRLLDLRWAPLAVGRRLNLLTEVLPVAESSLKNTFFTEGNNTCFYGVCYYCKREDPACGVGPMLEGAVILWLPLHLKLKTYRHPWRRLYKKGSLAPWETNDAYCHRVRSNKMYNRGSRLLDLIDISVFDFLIGNADRHRYEVLETFEESLVLLLDSGKSFGNPYVDEITILAPLYQCCQIRRSTWETLLKFSSRSLSTSLLQLISSDPVHPLLTSEHLLALDRRRLKVLNVIDFCLQERQKSSVFI